MKELKIDIINRLCCVWLSLVAMVAVAACAFTDVESVVEPEEPTYTIRLQLTTNGIFTRADDKTWDQNDKPDDGTAFEKTIQSINLFLLGNDGSILTRLYAVKDAGDAYVYSCTVGKDTPGIEIINESTKEAEFNGRIMVVANMPWDDSQDYTVTKLPYSLESVKSAGIPMWGVRKYENVTLKADVRTPLDEIALLRAVSKIEIKLDKDLESEFEIGEIVMAKGSDGSEGSPAFFAEGFGLPTGALTVGSTEALNLTGCFNVNENAAKISVGPTFEGSAVSKYTYVSESETDADKPFTLKVTLKSKHSDRPDKSKHSDRPDITGHIKISEYKDGQPSNTYTQLVRNHVYQFTVNLKELQFITTVKKWEMGANVHIDMEEFE